MTYEPDEDDEHEAAELLGRCRQDIDRIDAVLVALLCERARLAVGAGRLKTARGRPVTETAREVAVLERVRRLTGPPLDGDRIARIFERIIEETREAEQAWLEAERGR